MPNPQISVIVPMYNTSSYLESCINSLRNQTLNDIEIILIDDGSTDNTVELARMYSKGDRRISIIEERHANAGHARNVGLSVATGKYLSILDSDDFFEPNMLEDAFDRALETGCPDMVVFRADRYVESDGEYANVPWMLKVSKLPNRDVFDALQIKPNVFRSMIGWTWDKLFKRSLIVENRILFQEQRAFNDLVFTFSALVLASSIAILEGKPLVHQRKRGGGSISDKKNEAWPCIHPALEGLKRVLVNNGLYDRYRRDFINYSLHLIDNNLMAMSLEDSSFADFYNIVRTKWHYDFELPLHNASYYYVKSEWVRYRYIINHTFDEYLAHLADKESLLTITV